MSEIAKLPNEKPKELNAYKHGMRSKSILPHEREAYEIHWEGMHASLKPEGYFEKLLVGELASLSWRKARLANHEAYLISERRHEKLGEMLLGLENSCDNSRRGDDHVPGKSVPSLSLRETLLEIKRLTSETITIAQVWWDIESVLAYRPALLEAARLLRDLGSGAIPELPVRSHEALVNHLNQLLDGWGIDASRYVRKYSLLRALMRGASPGPHPREELPELWQVCWDQMIRHEEKPAELPERLADVLTRDAERVTELVARARLLITERMPEPLPEEGDVNKLIRYAGSLRREFRDALKTFTELQDKRRGSS